MKYVGIAIVAAIAVFALLVFARYETLAPLRGESSGGGARSSTGAAPTAPASTRKPAPVWTFTTTNDPITDAPFSRASIRTDDASLWVYMTDNTLHAGIRGQKPAAYDAREVTMRVDGNPAFAAPIFDKEDGIYVTLTEDQLDQIKAGNELLVRYEAALGAHPLLRFPLKGASKTIAQIGRPKPPVPRPD